MPRGRKRKVPPEMKWLLDKPEWMRRPTVEAEAKKANAALLAGLEEMKKGIKRLFGGVGISLQLACEMNDLYDESTEGHRPEILQRYNAVLRKRQTWRTTGSESTRLQGHKRRAVLLAHKEWIAQRRAAGWKINRLAIYLNKKTQVPTRTLNRWLAASFRNKT